MRPPPDVPPAELPTSCRWSTLVWKAGNSWVEDKAQSLGAALAFYAAFSMAPLLVIALGISSLVFPRERVRDHLQEELAYFLGPRGAEGIRDLLNAAQLSEQGLAATLLGLVTLLIGASGVFGQLQDALNTIWEVKPKENRGWGSMIRDRFVSFTLVLGTGFLLTVSLIVSTALSALGTWLGELLPLPAFLFHSGQIVGSIAVFALLFGMIFKFVPDATIGWRNVWIGAVVTSFLLVSGKFLIGIYLGRAAVASAYGAAASFAIVLLWLYYSSQILLLGAEFTYAHAMLSGPPPRPTSNARSVTEPERLQQGIGQPAASKGFTNG